MALSALPGTVFNPLRNNSSQISPIGSGQDAVSESVSHVFVALVGDSPVVLVKGWEHIHEN